MSDGALPDFAAFREAALARGFDAVVERRWEAGTVVASHRHPFAVDALVVQGEMWLRIGTALERRLVRGDRFRLDRNVGHGERDGPNGAVHWVARRGGSD